MCMRRRKWEKCVEFDLQPWHEWLLHWSALRCWGIQCSAQDHPLFVLALRTLAWWAPWRWILSSLLDPVSYQSQKITHKPLKRFWQYKKLDESRKVNWLDTVTIPCLLRLVQDKMLSLKSLRNSCFGRKFRPTFDILRITLIFSSSISSPRPKLHVVHGLVG